MSWSQPVEITNTFAAFKPGYEWKVIATGPNHSIQLKNGRLIVPVWLSTGEGGNAILFSNPHNLSRAHGKEAPGRSRDRKNLSIKLSRDDGQTWPVNKPLEPGPSMYSDLAVTPTGTILCFYGRSGQPGFAGASLTLARFNLDWLLNP